MRKVNSVFRLMIALVFAVVSVACTTAPPSIQTGPDAELSFDGLHMVDNSRADQAWARPDFDISGYTKIWPVGAGVEYRQVKNKGRTSMERSRSGPYFIDDDARARFEELVGQVFKEELQKSEKFELVGEPGPDVMMIRGGLLDVISHVPPDITAGRSEVFLSSVGEATLVLELRDSETGTILARSIDRRAAQSMGGQLQRSNRAINASEVRRVIRHWGTRLREGLDGFESQTSE